MKMCKGQKGCSEMSTTEHFKLFSYIKVLHLLGKDEDCEYMVAIHCFSTRWHQTKQSSITSKLAKVGKFFPPTLHSSNADSLLWKVWDQNINVVSESDWLNWWGNKSSKKQTNTESWMHSHVEGARDSGLCFSGKSWIRQQQQSMWRNKAGRGSKSDISTCFLQKSRMAANFVSAEALWIRGDHTCKGGRRWLLLEPLLKAMWLSFTPGLRIPVVTQSKPGSTAQRATQDFYSGHVKLENLCSALFSLCLRLSTQSPTCWVTWWGHILGQALRSCLLLGHRSPGKIDWAQSRTVSCKVFCPWQVSWIFKVSSNPLRDHPIHCVIHEAGLSID